MKVIGNEICFKQKECKYTLRSVSMFFAKSASDWLSVLKLDLLLGQARFWTASNISRAFD